MQGPGTLSYKKLIYAFLIAVKRLRPYFQGHSIMLLMDQSIKAVFHRTNASKRIIKWTIELTKFNINFQRQPSIKAQILIDFIVECTILNETKLEQNEIDIPWLQSSSLEGRADLPEGF